MEGNQPKTQESMHRKTKKNRMIHQKSRSLNFVHGSVRETCASNWKFRVEEMEEIAKRLRREKINKLRGKQGSIACIITDEEQEKTKWILPPPARDAVTFQVGCSEKKQFYGERKEEDYIAIPLPSVLIRNSAANREIEDAIFREKMMSASKITMNKTVKEVLVSNFQENCVKGQKSPEKCNSSETIENTPENTSLPDVIDLTDGGASQCPKSTQNQSPPYFGNFPCDTNYDNIMSFFQILSAANEEKMLWKPNLLIWK